MEHWLLLTSNLIWLPPTSRAMLSSFFTGMVKDPSLSTLASTVFDIVTSRSVAVSVSLFSAALKSTLDKMGRVVRVDTTFWTDCRPKMNSS
jgi:hypothetical protein